MELLIYFNSSDMDSTARIYIQGAGCKVPSCTEAYSIPGTEDGSKQITGLNLFTVIAILM